MGGFTLTELRAAGYGVGELYTNALFEGPALRAVGFTARDCHEQGMNLETMRGFKFTLRELIEGGYGPLQLNRVLGVGRRELVDNGMPDERLEEVNRYFPQENFICP